MTKKLIDAEALKHKRVIAIYGNLEQGLEEKEVVYVDDIDNAPAIEAKPVVHAHWEWTGVLGEKMFICSHCGECAHYDGTTWWTDPICWNCGAQMDGSISCSHEDDNHIAEDGKKGVKIPVISMEDVPKIAKEMEK